MTLSAHPEPLPELSSSPLPIVELRQTWCRTHAMNQEPIFFGRTSMHRFDAPANEYGVMYLGQDEHCAFIETFGHETGVRVVDGETLSKRGIAHVRCRRPLRLVKLHGDGLARLGVDARLATGDYTLAQRWSLAFHDHPDCPDGIAFYSRHDDQKLCAALFDRVAVEVQGRALGAWTDSSHVALLARVLDRYNFGLITTS
ncbi:MAG: RES family NAD+ phosphorylase [Deltaproteobacteria bacterium]|nr:RES family NAD+ phosphorylase [Deltaproteobacteria bacterium]